MVLINGEILAVRSRRKKKSMMEKKRKREIESLQITKGRTNKEQGSIKSDYTSP